MKDTKSLAWLLPLVAGLLILLGWFLGRAGWNLDQVDVGVGALKPPTATSVSQATQSSQPVVIPQPTSPSVVSSPASITSQGKYPCPLVIRQSEVERWKVGQTSVPDVQKAINQLNARRTDNAGAFVKGTTIPSDVVVAINFDERDASAWTRYPVIPLIHSGSWGLFQTTGEFIAPNAGACMTVVP